MHEFLSRQGWQGSPLTALVAFTGHIVAQAAVILNGGIEQLLNLVENVNPAAMNDVISASESCLQHNQDAAATACDAGAVPLLCGLLKDGNDIQVRCAASKCLCSLLLGAKASASSALVDAGGLSLLAGILRDKIGQDGKGSDSMMVTAALRVMIAGLAGTQWPWVAGSFAGMM